MEWAYEFRENMPKRLQEFIREKAAAITEKDHLANIKDRLKNVMDLYKVSRYRPAPSGMYLSDNSSSVHVGASPFSSGRTDAASGSRDDAGTTAKGPRDGEVGQIYHLFEKKDGQPSEKASVDPFPIDQREDKDPYRRRWNGG